jgi:hypothetical protein
MTPPARGRAASPVQGQIPAMLPDDPPPLLPDDSAPRAGAQTYEPAPAPAPAAAPPAQGRRPVSHIAPTVIAPPAPPTGSGRAPAILEEHRTMSRADFDREINDFDGLMTTVAVGPAPDGGFVLTRLEPGSWLASLGFREGDVVRNVAGERVSTVEDAARVYARLRSISSFTVEVQRGGTWVHIDIRIRDGR